VGTRTKSTADSTGRLCWWALGYALRRWPALLGVLATMLLRIGLDALRPWPLKVLVDNILGGKPMPEGLARLIQVLPGAGGAEGLLTWCVAGTVVLFLLGWGLGLAAANANISLGQRMTYDLAGDLFGHLQRLSLRFHSRKAVGDSIRRVTSDSGCAAIIVRDALLPVLTSGSALIVMFVIMWQLDPVLTLLALAVVPYMIFIFRRYARPMLERSYEQDEAEGRTYAVVEQTMAAIPVVQAFGREDHGNRRFRESTSATLTAALAATNVQLRFKVLMGLATAVGAAVVLWVGVSHALDGRLSVGSILVFLAYLGSLYEPLESLMYLSSTIQGAGGGARRVLEVLGEEPEVRDRPGAAALGAVAGHVALEAVTFGYEPGRPVLRGVGLEARPGQTVALVGATGAGKTTLAGLVPRLFDPWQGRVLLDGRDVRGLRLRDLRDRVALVPQEPFLFPLSVADNIAYGRPGASRDDVEVAARAANAHDFIARLPQGYDTVVGERGATLSGGERQRLAIARALLKDAPVLVLDEPTSALDAQTEALVLGALARLMRGRTTLVIAHRLSTVRLADRIVVLHRGEVAEAGTHDELLAHGGLYRRHHELQFGPATADRVG
jgi:ATP-binding cassette subfamily B protein/subfamily B ATP-binding cassette protein MsbA